MADLSKMKVEKKSGAVELFDRSKVLSGIMKSGMSAEHAEQVTSEVERWAEALPEETVPTSEIRAKVIELMRPLDSEAANAYETYKKSQ